MKAHVPKEFEDSYLVSQNKPQDGKQSIFRQFNNEETKHDPKQMNILERIGM